MTIFLRRFQKRHYDIIAKILKDSNSKEEIIERLIIFFQSDNERFDKERFLKAISSWRQEV